MTLKWFNKMYQHFKNHYDFRLARVSYAELERERDTEGELLPDIN